MRRTVQIAGQVETLFGTLDENMKLLESSLRVTTHLQDDHLTIEGQPADVARAAGILDQYNGLVREGRRLDNGAVKALLRVAAEDPGATYFLPYGMNMNLSPWNLPLAIKYNQVIQPEYVVAMADAPGPYASTFPSTRPYSPVARHASRINLLFLAGGVQSFAGSYVGCGKGDPRRADVHWLTGTASDSAVDNY